MGPLTAGRLGDIGEHPRACREIVTQHGVVVAVAADPAMGEEITRRLNKSDWGDQEDQWAL